MRQLCKFVPHILKATKTNRQHSIIDEGLKFLERKFFIQKGNEKLELANGRPKKE